MYFFKKTAVLKNNMIKIRLPKGSGNLFFIMFCAIVLVFSLRGLPGNPTITELQALTWRDNGPFELSPERGRFALLYSLIENNSFSFSREIAFFAAPDVAYTDGRYVSLFAPGLSFTVMPGYLIGKYFGVSQVGTFAIISLFSLCNVFLIKIIAVRLGAHPIAAMIAGFGFLFATPAFAYAVNLYQHHISTFLILLSCYLLLRFKTVWSLVLIWILCGFSIIIDYPNFFMLLPIGVFALSQMFFVHKSQEGVVFFTFSLGRVLTCISLLIPLFFFCWFNLMSYGKPFQLAGALERPMKINADGTPVLSSETGDREEAIGSLRRYEPGSNTGVIRFFVNRNMMNGFYTHFVSGDRGMLVYTPVMFFAVIGIYIAWKKKLSYLSLFLAIIGFNIVVYSMWGDPYGGWAFGSRYLIPSYAILSFFIAIALTKFQKHIISLLIFFIVLSYSLAINTLGAVTSSRNPPKVEIAGLEKLSGKKEHYTFLRNIELLDSGRSKSFLFQSVAHTYLSAWNYYILLSSFSISFAGLLMFMLMRTKRKE